MKGNVQPVHGALRVWWIPQVPGTPFYVIVDSVREAVKLMYVLADYDKFQFDNRIKPDYCNMGGLESWDSEINEDTNEPYGWCSWVDEDIGIDDPDEYLQHLDEVCEEELPY